MNRLRDMRTYLECVHSQIKASRFVVSCLFRVSCMSSPNKRPSFCLGGKKERTGGRYHKHAQIEQWYKERRRERPVIWPKDLACLQRDTFLCWRNAQLAIVLYSGARSLSSAWQITPRIPCLNIPHILYILSAVNRWHAYVTEGNTGSFQLNASPLQVRLHAFISSIAEKAEYSQPVQLLLSH